MSITITGFLIIAVAIYLLFKQGVKKSILDPRILILFMFWSFWGKTTSIDIKTEPDIMLAMSFIIFWITMTIASKLPHMGGKRFLEQLTNRIEPNRTISNMSSSTQLKLLILICLYVIFNLYINSVIYGSLSAALTRFYYRLPVNELPSIYTRLVNIMNIATMGLLFMIRYSNIKYKQSNIIFYIGLTLMCFVTLPRGSRGALLMTIIIPYMADVLRFCLYKEKLTSLFKIQNLMIGGIAIFLAVFLTAMRGSSFEDFSSVQEEMMNFEFDEGIEQFKDKEEDLMMRDYYYTYETYGNRIDFLPIYYTFFAIVTNPVPRSLWADKPVTFGRLLTSNILGVHSKREMIEDVRNSRAVGICGEGWANGGIWGVLLYSILLGVYGGYLISMFRFLIMQEKYSSLILAVLIYRAASSYIRGDILSGVTQAIYPIIALIIVMIVISSIKQYRKV